MKRTYSKYLHIFHIYSDRATHSELQQQRLDEEKIWTTATFDI